MRKKFILVGLFISTATVYMACSKGGDNPPSNPCAGVTVSVTGTVTNASQGQTNGSISVNATGGSGFTYSINSGAFQSSGTFSNLAAGSYTITAKNSNGCTGSQQFTVGTTNACAGVTINVSTNTSTATPCPNPNSGSITVTASGGTAPYTYSMNGGSFVGSNVFSSQAAGNYNLVAKDANGCTSTTAVATVGVTPAGPLFSSVKTIVQSNCATSGCHTGGSPAGGISFSVDCNIVAHAARIKARAVDAAGTAQQMPPPPAAPLSQANRDAITAWVNAGGGYTN